MLRSIEERNAIVEKHLDLAKICAYRRHKTVNSTVQYDELLSAAYRGLINAAERYDGLKRKADGTKAKASFEVYAQVRIWGEMNDYLRSCMWGTRKHSFTPISIESSRRCGAKSYSEPGDTSYPNIGSLLSESGRTYFDDMQGKQLFEKIIKPLSFRDKAIFRMRFRDEMTMKDIADSLNISESRISQIISDSVEYLWKVWNSRRADLWSETSIG